MTQKLNITLKIFTTPEHTFQNMLCSSIFIYNNSKPIKKILLLDWTEIIDENKKVPSSFFNKILKYGFYQSRNYINIKINNNYYKYYPKFNETSLFYNNLYDLSPFLLDIYLTKFKSNILIEIISKEDECENCGSFFSKIINFYLNDKLILSTKHNLLNCENSIPFLTGSELINFSVLNDNDEEVNNTIINKLLFEYLKQINYFNKNFSFNIEENVENLSSKTEVSINLAILKILKLSDQILFNWNNDFIENIAAFYFKYKIKSIINKINNDDKNVYIKNNLNRESDKNECCIKYGKDKSLLMALEILESTIKNKTSFRTFANKTYYSTLKNNHFILEDLNKNILINYDISNLTKEKRMVLLEKIRESIEYLFWK